MGAPAITMDVRRVGEKTAVVDIKGEVTAAEDRYLARRSG